jgi:hypothetical protein
MKYFLKTAMLMAMIAVCTQFAAATAILSISDGTNTVWAEDDQFIPSGNQVPDNYPIPGAITIIQSFANWTMNVSTGVSKPVVGNAIDAELDLNTIDVSSAAGGTLTVMFSDNNFGPLPENWYFKSSVGGTTVGTVSVKTYYDPTNVVHRIGDLSLGTLATEQLFSPTAFSGTAGSQTPDVILNSYSLTQVITITHANAGVTSLDANLKAVPEPSTLLLLGSGFSCLGLSFFRKRNRQR